MYSTKLTIFILWLALTLTLSGCAYIGIKDIDVSKAEPSCTRQCAATYSQCVSGGGLKTERTLRACKEAYEICISSCPIK